MSSLPENEVINKTLRTIHKYRSINQLKQAVQDNDYTPENSKFLRSLLWKAVYITESLNIQQWLTKLNDSRRVYHELIKGSDMIIPWYKLENDDPFFQTIELSRNSSLRSKKRTTNMVKKSRLARVQVNDVDDPLNAPADIEEISNGLSNTHIPYDDDVELLRCIILDIDRLFPGEEFFDNQFYKKQIIEVLYVWAKCNPKVGYKQGFHEILGLIYINIRKDSVEVPSTNTFSSDDLKVLNLFDAKYLCHDLFTLFNKFMVNTGIIASYYENETALLKSIESFNQYLMKVDQLIHYSLISKLKLESQLWCIRYFRLLLLRELGSNLSTANLLWDKLITVESNRITQVLTFCIIVLLMNIKADLIICDFSEALGLLLHYPPKFENNPNEFIHELFIESLKLYTLKDNDLKLYEQGMKINQKVNPDLKISLSFNGRTSGESMRSRTASPTRKISTDSVSSLHGSNGSKGSSAPKTMEGKNSKAEQMAFEKYRLEMRLKKKAQLLMRS